MVLLYRSYGLVGIAKLRNDCFSGFSPRNMISRERLVRAWKNGPTRVKLIGKSNGEVGRMELRFWSDPETGLPHIYDHGVSEEEVRQVLSRPGPDSGRPLSQGSLRF